MPGMLVLRNDGFDTSANPIVAVTGLGSLVMAPFGAHALNIAAITAAIATGREAHEDPGKDGSPGLLREAFTSGWDIWCHPGGIVHGITVEFHHPAGRPCPAGCDCDEPAGRWQKLPHAKPP